MEIRALNDDDTTPLDVYYFDRHKKEADVRAIFKIRRELLNLRVETGKLNYLYSKLSPESFMQCYNAFYQRLNFNFDTILLNNTPHVFSVTDHVILQQKMICDLIYFFTQNNFKRVLVRKADFTHAFQIKSMFSFIENLYGYNHSDTILIVAHIFRMNKSDVIDMDKQTREWESMF